MIYQILFWFFSLTAIFFLMVILKEIFSEIGIFFGLLDEKKSSKLIFLGSFILLLISLSIMVYSKVMIKMNKEAAMLGGFENEESEAIPIQTWDYIKPKTTKVLVYAVTDEDNKTMNQADIYNVSDTFFKSASIMILDEGTLPTNMQLVTKDTNKIVIQNQIPETGAVINTENLPLTLRVGDSFLGSTPITEINISYEHPSLGKLSPCIKQYGNTDLGEFEKMYCKDIGKVYSRSPIGEYLLVRITTTDELLNQKR